MEFVVRRLLLDVEAERSGGISRCWPPVESQA